VENQSNIRGDRPSGAVFSFVQAKFS